MDNGWTIGFTERILDTDWILSGPRLDIHWI